jgi:hypothetical protein
MYEHYFEQRIVTLIFAQNSLFFAIQETMNYFDNDRNLATMNFRNSFHQFFFYSTSDVLSSSISTMKGAPRTSVLQGKVEKKMRKKKQLKNQFQKLRYNKNC